jgi:hypothetical protein
MKTRCSLAVLAALLVGCASTEHQDHVTLIEVGPDKQLLLVTKRYWAGLWGPEGYIGHENATYWIALSGPGPTFVNPHFEGSRFGAGCIGTVVLDREHHRVSLDMRRVISKDGTVNRTKPHPINGAYAIDSVRKAHRGEEWPRDATQ